MNSDSNQDELIEVLEAHGKQFLSSFNLPLSNVKKRKSVERHESTGKSKARKLETRHSDAEESSEGEWLGFGTYTDGRIPAEGDTVSNADQDFEENDDGFTADAPNHSANVVVFTGPPTRQDSSSQQPTRAQLKAFMSSKVSKLRQDVGDRPKPQTSAERADDDDERTNTENDALLRRLIHTKLLSGSLNPDLNLKRSQRQKALEGRVMELAQGAKLGKGEKTVREDERNKAATRVRVGMLNKQKEREEKQLEETKNLGNYHPTIKKLFEPSSSAPINRKRENGLTMGVGKFKGGVLKLSRDDVATMQGSSVGGSTRGRSTRGGSRGGPKKRRGT